ncbi:MAG: ABC transporter substrate-binding protein, partial [Candidatus Dormibacteraceae bacterium]
QMLGLGVVAPALAIPLLEACGKPAASASKLATVRLGYQTNIWGMPLVVAISSKYFHGVPLQQTQVTSGNKTRDLMVAGQVDMGTFAAHTFIVGAAKGQLQTVCVVADVGKTLSMLSQKSITSVPQLKGKKIGFQPGASSTVIAQQKVLPSFGLKTGDYQTVNVDQSNLVSALAAHSIDAYGGAVEPYGAMVVSQGLGTKLVTFEKYDLLPVLLCVRPQFAKANHATVVAMVEGMLRVQKLFQSNHGKVVDIVQQFYNSHNFNLSKSIIENAIGEVKVNVGITPELTTYLQGVAQSELKLGHISSLPDINTVLPKTYLAEASKNLNGG